MTKQTIAAIALALSSGIAAAQSTVAKPGFYAGLDLGRSRLGLAIAQRAVDAHGGAIRASNVPGGGLSVEIELPLAHG